MIHQNHCVSDMKRQKGILLTRRTQRSMHLFTPCAEIFTQCAEIEKKSGGCFFLGRHLDEGVLSYRLFPIHKLSSTPAHFLH